jgi:hypothetical protein
MVTHWGSFLKAKLLHQRVRYLSRCDWNNRHRKVFQLNAGYGAKCDAFTEASHLKKWRRLRSDVSINTLRVCHGISGAANPDIVPEEVYVSEIEPCLNRYQEVAYLANKNLYNRWFPDGIFPTTFLHNIDGDLYDSSYQKLDQRDLDLALLPYPVVYKPSLGPGGGYGVCFPANRQELEEVMRNKTNFVVQEKLAQHQFLQRYSSSSLNTFRVCTYRSVKDNQIHVLNVSMRMGKGGSLDNETAGGIVCAVREDGSLNSYAVDKYGVKFSRHPDSGIDFSQNTTVPDFQELLQVSRQIAGNVFLARLVSLDACLDEEGKWRIIEINLKNQTIRFAQYAGKPFFGAFTEEVIGYCLQHRNWR